MKLSTLLPAAAGLGIGYFAGAAAGRGRYRQIVTAATKVVQHPRVQEFVFDVAGKARTNAAKLPGPAADVTDSAATRLQDYLTQPDDSATPAAGSANSGPTSPADAVST